MTATAPSSGSSGSVFSRVSRATWLKLAAFALVLVSAFVAFRFTPLADHLTEEKVVAFFSTLRGMWWTPLLLTGLYVLLSCVGIPVSPLMISGGAVFGFALGTFYNTVGLIAGGLASFTVARFLGRDFVEQIGGRRLKQAERLFERHGFWPLVQTRFLPIPFTLVNFAAALAGVRVGKYTLALIVGLIPSTVIHTYFMSALFAGKGNRWVTLVVYGAAMVVFNLIIGWPSLRTRLRRRERYREILASRGARRQDQSGSSRPR